MRRRDAGLVHELLGGLAEAALDAVVVYVDVEPVARVSAAASSGETSRPVYVLHTRSARVAGSSSAAQFGGSHTSSQIAS